MSYTIMISEKQRALLAAVVVDARRVPGRYDANDNTELTLLMEMLLCLPEQEAETPGALHGFCL